MGSKSTYLENALLDHVLGGGNYARPATVYLALYTAAPGDAGGGTEVTAGGYGRVAVTNDATNWPAAADGAKALGVAQSFPAATESWPEVVAFGILDNSTGGHLLYWAELTVPKTIQNGDTARFGVGDLVITED